MNRESGHAGRGLDRSRRTEASLRIVLAAASLALIASCGSTSEAADPASDAPEGRYPSTVPYLAASSYTEALRAWRTAEDVNAWMGAAFEYDMSRAMALSETQRSLNGAPAIARPGDFFATPRGVCIDLSRFAVETLRALDPQSQPNYLMIEFAPVSVAGNTLRRHWLATFRREGHRYFFADSKRPGHLAGPYATIQEFIREYEAYRGRRIVAFRELESYERRVRAMASRQPRAERP